MSYGATPYELNLQRIAALRKAKKLAAFNPDQAAEVLASVATDALASNEVGALNKESDRQVLEAAVEVAQKVVRTRRKA